MTRSLKDGANIFAELFRQGKGFVSATEKMDFSSPSGRAMLGMMQVSSIRAEQTAENTRNKMMSIARAGLWPSGNPPYGYMRGEKKDNNLYIDPAKAEIVKDIFDMYAGQIFDSDILHKYRSEVHQTQIFTMLRNETYLGYIIYADHKFPANTSHHFTGAL
jgi:DNA invertase Pin-like site-specific DNA recombinase